MLSIWHRRMSLQGKSIIFLNTGTGCQIQRKMFNISAEKSGQKFSGSCSNYASAKHLWLMNADVDNSVELAGWTFRASTRPRRQTRAKRRMQKCQFSFRRQDDKKKADYLRDLAAKVLFFEFPTSRLMASNLQQFPDRGKFFTECHRFQYKKFCNRFCHSTPRHCER
jgi:hypothetical protein